MLNLNSPQQPPFTMNRSNPPSSRFSKEIVGMEEPLIELIPLRAAVSCDHPTTLDVLVRIVPPAVELHLKRPPLNLSLVIDRSGSMKGQKIELVRQAACYAVQQLRPTDRVSIITFDRAVHTLVNSTLADDKANIIYQIQQIEPGSGSALHAGWLGGAVQVVKNLNMEHLNRVILLSDGLAGVGERNNQVIGTDVYDLAQRGVSTSTMGVGNAYYENLLMVMARQGGGQYYYIASTQKLPTIFRTELQDLIATIGHSVTLAINPQGAIEIEDVLNELTTDHKGRFQLPNLVMGNPLEVLVRLQVPPVEQPADLSYFRVTWTDPQQEVQHKIHKVLHLPIMTSSQLEEFLPHPQVQQRVTLMMAARAKKEAMLQIAHGNYEVASQLLKDARRRVLCAPN
jgi:Ca-activated chloride channel homolog